MLVLTRKLQEQVHIGGNITITILRVKGNAVRIGIEAPRNVRVVRGELDFLTPPSNGASSNETSSEEADAESEPSGEPTLPYPFRKTRNNPPSSADVACHAL